MHRFITKTVVFASALAISVASFAGCAKKNDENNYAVVGITQEPGIFDPHTVVAAGDDEVRLADVVEIGRRDVGDEGLAEGAVPLDFEAVLVAEFTGDADEADVADADDLKLWRHGV